MNTFFFIALCASILIVSSTFIKKPHDPIDKTEHVGNINIPVHEKKIAYEKKCQKVTIVYPQFPGICPKINQSIEDVINKELGDYRALCNKAESQEYFKDTPEAGWYLTINYTLVQANERYLSLRLSRQIYVGAPHDYNWDECFNYDLKTQKKLTIEDIEPSPHCLEVVSNLCYQKITEQPDKWGPKKPAFLYHLLSHEGLLPIAKNFERFTFTDDTINIHFQEYQVTCYMSGVPKVVLDRNELKTLFSFRKRAF